MDFAIVISPKKEAIQIQIYVVLRWVNTVTIEDPFLIPFINNILEEVVRHRMYLFMDGFSSYNQINIAQEDKLKIMFMGKDGLYAYN